MSWFWRQRPSRKNCASSKQEQVADFAIHKERTSQRKFAVFQVSEPGERVALVCLEMRSLQAAAELEHWLRMNVSDKTLVKLLGRFDSVYFPSGETGIEAVVLSGERIQSTHKQP